MEIEKHHTLSYADYSCSRYTTIQTRARILASVFLMQALGQLTACLMSLFLLATIGKNYSYIMSTAYPADSLVVDQIWRMIVGLAPF